jgi:ribonuclease G
MARDPARNKITGVSELGLIEMTRKRTARASSACSARSCPSLWPDAAC